MSQHGMDFVEIMINFDNEGNLYIDVKNDDGY